MYNLNHGFINVKKINNKFTIYINIILENTFIKL